MRTMWLLDFDGVVNANKAGWSAAPYSGMAYADGYSYRIRWEPKLVARIRHAHKNGVLIFWCSSWCGHTDQLEQLIKLPPLLSVRFERMSYLDKTIAAEDVIDSGNRLIWTDDEAVPSFGALYNKLTQDKRALLIRPKANRGLRPEHMDLIDDFVKDA